MRVFCDIAGLFGLHLNLFLGRTFAHVGRDARKGSAKEKAQFSEPIAMQKGELRRRQGDRVVRDEDEDRVIDSRLQPNNGWEIEQSEVGEAEDERIGERIPLLDKRTGGETKLESNIKAQALGVTKKDWIVGILKLLLDQVSTFFNEKTPPFLSIAYFTSFFVTPKVDDKTLALLKVIKLQFSAIVD